MEALTQYFQNQIRGGKVWGTGLFDSEKFEEQFGEEAAKAVGAICHFGSFETLTPEMEDQVARATTALKAVGIEPQDLLKAKRIGVTVNYD